MARETVAADIREREAKIREQRGLVEMELNDAHNETLDVEGLLRFAENALMNAGSMWSNASVQVKQDVQSAFFPKGLQFNGTDFGTVVTCLPFEYLRGRAEEKTSLASPTGFEPVS